MSVYLTAQVLGIVFAVLVGWELLAASVPVWGAVLAWLSLSAYLSRKRLPSEALGSGLQFGAVAAALAPIVPYALAAVDGAGVDPVAIATDLFGPTLLFFVLAAIAYVSGLLLKRRARRKLTRRARKGVYQ